MSEYRAQFPSAVASVGKARRAITAFARQWFSGDELGDIESAVGEALANCAEHGHCRDGAFEVRCRYADETFSIEIKDGGSGFEHWNVTDCPQPPSSAPRGYGTFIMRRLMDEMEYSDRGTRLRLVKRVPVERSSDVDEFAGGDVAGRSDVRFG